MCAFDTWLTHSTSTNSDFYRERTSKRLNNVCRPYDSRTRGSHQRLCRVKTTETSLLARRQWAYASQGKTWLQSESRDTMAAILQGGSLGFDLKVFLFFFFWSQTISTRPLSCWKAMRLHWSLSAHESETSGVRFQVALRLPFNTLNSLLAWASELLSQSKHPETAVQTF